MAGQRATKRNRRSRSAKARRRRVVGLGASAAAFLAFGVTPLTTAPTAHADEFDAIIDPILNTLISSVDHSWVALDPSWAALDPSAVAVDPSAGIEVSSVTHPVSAAVSAATPPQEEISANAAASTPTCPAGTVCEISENGSVIVNTCLIGGVQECTAISADRVGDTATAIGAGSSAYAEGGPGDTAYATLGGEAIAKGSYDEATAEGTRSLAEAYGSNVAASPTTAIATGTDSQAYAGISPAGSSIGTGGTDDYAIAARGGEAIAVAGSDDQAGAAGSGAGSDTLAIAAGGNNNTATALGTDSGAFASDGNNDTATANGDNAEAAAGNGNGDRATAAGNAANLTDNTSTTAFAGGLGASGSQAEIAGNSDTATATGTGAEAYAGNDTQLDEYSGSSDYAKATGDDAEAFSVDGTGDQASAIGNAGNLTDHTVTEAYAGGNIDAGPANSDIAYASGTASQAWAGSDPALQYTGSSDTATATGGSAATTAGVAEAYNGNNLSASAGPGQTVINNDGVIGAGSQSVTALIPLGSYPSGVAVSPINGDIWVTSTGDSSVFEINPATNSVVATIPVGTDPWAVAVSPTDGDVYVAYEYGDTASVINPTTDAVTPITIPEGGTNEQNGLAVSPINGDIYVISQQINGGTIPDTGTVSVIDPNTNQVFDTIDLNPTLSYELPVGVAVSPINGDIYVLNEPNALGIGSNVSVINTSNEVVDTIPYTPEAFEYEGTSGLPGIAVSPTGAGAGDVYFTGTTGGIAVIDPASNPANDAIDGYITAGDGGFTGLAVSPTGTYAGDIYAVDQGGPSGPGVQVINPTTNTLIATIDNGGSSETDFYPWAVAFGPAGVPGAGDAYATDYDDPGHLVVIK